MNRSTVRFVSFLLIASGTYLAFSAALPLIKYEISSIGISKQDFISPLGENPILLNNSNSLVNANNWFTGTPELTHQEVTVKYYKISIPKLKIKDAVVEIAGEDLSKNLIHFKDTAPPGKPGNAVIFGHSTLPQLYNPKSYLTTFTYLPSLKNDDEIMVDYDGITYKYSVIQMFEVKPEDIEILEQKYDNSYLTLVTCVPPGTSIKRLIVKAKLVPYHQT